MVLLLTTSQMLLVLNEETTHHSQYVTPSLKQNQQFCTQSINVPHGMTKTKLGLKIRSFSKSSVQGLLKNVLTFNPRWLEGRVVVAQTSENRRGAFQNTPREPQY